jgi:hypothetical protein
MHPTQFRCLKYLPIDIWILNWHLGTIQAVVPSLVVCSGIKCLHGGPVLTVRLFFFFDLTQEDELGLPTVPQASIRT